MQQIWSLIFLSFTAELGGMQEHQAQPLKSKNFFITDSND